MPKKQYPSTIIKKIKDKLGIRLYNAQSNDIGILIGANTPHVHIPSDVKAAESSDRLAIKIMFGWTLFGTHGETKTISINKLKVDQRSMKKTKTR